MKITATIMDDGIETGETLTGKSLTEIYRQMCGMLSVAGSREMHARTAQGAEIFCSPSTKGDLQLFLQMAV